jgi:molybdopterin synthase catalytic subunit
MQTLVQITDLPIAPDAVINLVRTDNSGAINVFIGTVRNSTQNREVIKLEFEAYESMALKELQKIVDQVKARWPVNEIAIHHRVGELAIGDVPVVIAVSTPHRSEGFEACEFAIDTLKLAVPIWKKEIFADGEEWVFTHP